MGAQKLLGRGDMLFLLPGTASPIRLHNAYVTLDVLSFARSGTVLIMLVLGGAGRLYGAFVGTAVYMILEDELAKLSPEFWEFGIGLLLVVVVLFFRRGLLGALEDLQRRLS